MSETTSIEASKSEEVASDKYMTTKATLYRNGKLMVEVYTDNDNFWHALRGHVVVVVSDKDGNAIGGTEELSCSFRGQFAAAVQAGNRPPEQIPSLCNFQRTSQGEQLSWIFIKKMDDLLGTDSKSLCMHWKLLLALLSRCCSLRKDSFLCHNIL